MIGKKVQYETLKQYIRPGMVFTIMLVFFLLSSISFHSNKHEKTMVETVSLIEKCTKELGDHAIDYCICVGDFSYRNKVPSGILHILTYGVFWNPSSVRGNAINWHRECKTSLDEESKDSVYGLNY